MQGALSAHAPFLGTLPAATLSPLLWSEEQLAWLRGSPVAAEARSRRAALESEWAGIANAVAADPSLYPAGDNLHFTLPASGSTVGRVFHGFALFCRTLMQFGRRP